jgi:hypothetical protein
VAIRSPAQTISPWFGGTLTLGDCKTLTWLDHVIISDGR